MKQYYQYQMDFSGKWLGYSALCMGMSLFLTALYYLGLNNLKDIGTGELIFCLWLPLMGGVGYLALLRIKQWNAPGIYAIIGAVFCVLYILGSFTGGAVKGLFAVPAYVICGAVLLVIVGGFFPAKLPAALVFGIVIVLRIILFDLGRLSWQQWIQEGAPLFSMAAFMFLPLGLTSVNKRNRELP